MSAMPSGRRVALVLAVLVVLVLAALAALAALAVIPLLVAVASALLALAGGLRLRGTADRRRWLRPSPRSSPQRWPLAPLVPNQLGPTWTTSWPTLPAPDELPVVRERVAALLTEWDICGEAAQPTLLVLTELLTNAIEHADAPIRITVGFSSAFVRVQVRDAASQPPQRRPHDPTRLGGHGLEIVDALSLRRGWILEPDGKTVWADAPTDWPEPPPLR
jgi:hypothetical protein